LQHFESVFSDRNLDSIKPDEIYHFLEQMTKTLSRSTRRLRYAQLKACFNFIIEKCLPDLKNPCSNPLLSKTFVGNNNPARKSTNCSARRTSNTVDLTMRTALF
jgi:integrase